MSETPGQAPERRTCNANTSDQRPSSAQYAGRFDVGRRHQNVALPSSQNIVGDAASHHATQHRAVLRSDDQEIGLDASNDLLDGADWPCLLKNKTKTGTLHSGGHRVSAAVSPCRSAPIPQCCASPRVRRSLQRRADRGRATQSRGQRTPTRPLEKSTSRGDSGDSNKCIRQLCGHQNGAIPLSRIEVRDQHRTARQLSDLARRSPQSTAPATRFFCEPKIIRVCVRLLRNCRNGLNIVTRPQLDRRLVCGGQSDRAELLCHLLSRVQRPINHLIRLHDVQQYELRIEPIGQECRATNGGLRPWR